MAEATEFTIGAKANCSDGSCGEINRLIIDPAAGSVTHLVITPGHDRAAGRIVPVEMVDVTGGAITVRCSLAEFAQLPHATERELTPDMPGTGGGLIGADYGIQPGTPRMIIEDVVPVGETDVSPGDRVHAADGEIGRVHGFLVDSADHRVTHVLLQEGHFWGRKEVSIPISAVTGFDGGIQLNLTKKQVEELPPVS